MDISPQEITMLLKYIKVMMGFIVAWFISGYILSGWIRKEIVGNENNRFLIIRGKSDQIKYSFKITILSFIRNIIVLNIVFFFIIVFWLY